MRNKIGTVIVLFIVLAIFMGLANEIKTKTSTKENDTPQVASETEPDYGEYYTYGDVEKMVMYLADSDDVRQTIARLIDPLSKSQYITVEFVKNISDVIGTSEKVYENELSGMADDACISTEQFERIYQNIVDSGIVQNLARKDIYVYNVSGLQADDNIEYYISDTKESYVLDTELPEECYDSIIDVYVKENVIFKINGLGTSDVTLEHVWISLANEGQCTFLYNDLEKTYIISQDNTDTDAELPIKDRVADIIVNNSGITSITCYDSIKRVHITEITDSGFKTEKDGGITRGTDFKIYNTYHDAFCENSLAILVGYSEVKLVYDGEYAIAAIIDSEIYSDDIRVIISNDTYSSYDMAKAEITCDSGFKVTYPDEHESYYAAGDAITISYDSFEKGDVISVETTDYYGRLKINNITRNYGAPSYAGLLEIDVLEDSLHIINVVPLEEYLYSVVSSEMPASSEPEALKALAICARGYAYTKMNDGSFSEYNAHLDDSSLCQVYNSVEETKSAILAVKDTYGVVPTYEDSVIVPLYFSTSCGVTCTNEEIWGGNAYPYLESNLETISRKKVDLSQEDTFREFMDNNLGNDIIEQDMPYYRWHIDYTADDITNAINSMLEERISMSSDNIKVRNDAGDFESAEDVFDIGQVESIEVTERTESGVVAKLQITGSKAVIEVTGQTNIRNLITPVKQEIVRQDGFSVTGWTSLPSPFYYVEKTDEGFTIYGGGFGHGVGMSQNGANVLAEEGYNYKYILRHYYSYIDFTSIYDISSEEEEQ